MCLVILYIFSSGVCAYSYNCVFGACWNSLSEEVVLTSGFGFYSYGAIKIP